MKVQLKLLIGFGIAVLAGLALYPSKQTIVPAVRIRILDEAGNPAPGTLVQEKWEYSSVAGVNNYREKSFADENGYASFPERTERVSILVRFLSGVVEVIHLPHGYGHGSRWTIWAYGDDPHVWYYVPLSWYEKVPQDLRLKQHIEERTADDTKWP